jgi:hypothetical protein
MKRIIAASMLVLLYAGTSLACDCDPAFGLLNRLPSRLSQPWDDPNKKDESKGFDQQRKQDAATKTVEPRQDTAPSGTGQK